MPEGLYEHDAAVLLAPADPQVVIEGAFALTQCENKLWVYTPVHLDAVHIVAGLGREIWVRTENSWGRVHG